MPFWLSSNLVSLTTLAEADLHSGSWTMTFTLLAVAAALVVANGFFVAAEFALVKIRPSRIDDMVNEGRRFAPAAKWLASRLEQSLSAGQLGITMASLALGWVGEPAFAKLVVPVLEFVSITNPRIQEVISFIVAFTVITALHLVIGEQAPKIFAIREPEKMLLWCAVPMKAFFLISYPLMSALNATTTWLLNMVGLSQEDSHGETFTETEIRALVHQAHIRGELTRNERTLIDAIFEFDDLVCRRIMLPRHDVAFVDVSEPVPEMMAMIRRTRHTRYPVCDGSLDDVVGILHIKDLLQEQIDDKFDFRSIARPPRKVPDSLPVGKLLRHFQGTHQLMAFVIDEYGTVIGIVTLENVMEQIVGDVADEFDIEDPEIVPDGPGQFVAVGSTPIEDLEQRLNVTFSAPEADTLSGLLMHYAQEIVEEGQSVQMGVVRADVLDASNGRAVRVRLTLPEESIGSVKSRHDS
ncbi:MAG: hemolysin family protein [Fuerstiella sp.]|nr:hemolysin family protein [Fuerstiella sp.]